MIPLGLNKQQRNAYYRRLFSSHDYQVAVHICDADELLIGGAQFLDGQINFQADSDVRRTASITISDPDGALDFDSSDLWSSHTVWASRLIRVRHMLEVPEIRRTVGVTAFVGPPAALNRAGAEVTLECHDKTALAYRGTKPMTVPKGMNAVQAIRKIMHQRTGEWKFRLPKLKNARLSRPYSVGWADDASPWKVCQRIARLELDRQLFYSADGWLTLRKRPTNPALTVPAVTELPAMDVDFTTLNNYVRVLGKKSTKTIKDKNSAVTTTITTQPEAVTWIRSGHRLSMGALARKKVPRYWPLIINEDSITTVAKAMHRAETELGKSDQLQDAPSYSCVPFFHGDVDDLVAFRAPEGTIQARLADVTIPLGTGGDMTVGSITRNVSGRPRYRRAADKHLRIKKTRPKLKKNKKKTTTATTKKKG